jgi:intracellular sulfur oxidation DsrE/DsrF family protein
MNLQRKAQRSLALCALLLCLLASWSSTVAFGQAKTHHVVFAVTSGDEADWKLTLANMRNLLIGFGTDPYEVELVAFGPGITMLAAPSAVGDDIKAMQEKQVHFKACQNAMRARKLTLADLVPGSEPVPAGIVELVTKQEQGWIYIKGGR